MNGTSFLSRLRNSFLAGLVICAPLFITIWLVWSFIGWADGWVKPYIPPHYNPEEYLQFAIPGLGLVIAVTAITIVGFLASNLIGQWIVGLGESVLQRMPLVRTIYKSLKQIFETVLKEQSTSFKTCALIEFPTPGMWALAFVAGETRGEVAARLSPDGEPLLAVFMPPTPVPTAGFLMFVPKSKVIILDMTPEEGAKLVISGGLITPDFDPARLARADGGAAITPPATA